MIKKSGEKTKAVALRKEGFSYSQILNKVPVAKSTLSLWLRNVGLSRRQTQRLTEKRLAAAQRGADARRLQRIENTKRIKESARAEISMISRKEFWLMGIMLYWAEGSKEKTYGSAINVIFSNSDPEMLKLFLLWLKRSCNIPNGQLKFEIYIHEMHRNRIILIQKYWAKALRVPLRALQAVYFKKNKSISQRHNRGEHYYGQVRIRVRCSSDLNRKISGWVEGISNFCQNMA